MMAASIPVSSNVASRVQGNLNISRAGAGSDKKVLPRSQFLGSGGIHMPWGTRRTTQTVVHNAAKAGGTIRNASFFEKLAQLFSSDKEDQEQVLTVFELNHLDRGSPVFLPAPTKHPSPTLGTLVPYTNKVYDASANDDLGISAGLCVCIENSKGSKGGDRYETTYTHYLDGFGQLSAMGPYFINQDSEMVVTGGTGIFKGARGTVKIHSVVPPVRIRYTYYITGIEKLPSKLTKSVAHLPFTPAPVPAKA